MVKLYQETTKEPGSRPLPPNERIDRSYNSIHMILSRIFTSLSTFSRQLPRAMRLRANGSLCFTTCRIVFPMEFRFVAADQVWLSPNYMRNSVVISVSGKPGTDYWPYLKMCDERLFEQGGRPHWGKLHFMTGKRLTFPVREV